MKRLLVALSLALLLSLVVGVEVASATHSEGEGPKQSFAQGTAKFELPDGTALLHVNAKDELDPRGHFFLREEKTVQDALDLMGEVPCLNVTGNKAVMVGEVTKSNLSQVPAGSGIFIVVEDNGEGSDAPPDGASLIIPVPPDTPCAETGLGGFPSDKGNFVVHDATP